MDNETEVILEQMEGTRASLAEKLETLENQVVGTIQEATSTVAETVQQVKEAVTGTVDTVKETVEGTVEAVKETVEGTVETVKETFDVRRQVAAHPWLLFGGSVAAGFVAARLMHYGRSHSHARMPAWTSAGERSWKGEPAAEQEFQAGGYQAAAERAPRGDWQQPQTSEARPGWMESLSSVVGPELGKLKGLAIGATLAAVRDLITQQTPPEVGSHVTNFLNDLTTRLGGQVFQEPILQRFTGEHRRHEHNGGQHHEESVLGSKETFQTGQH
jgi:ElaB/YqjD/DUF883 family membrane-anchored ribosome-binding protein